MFVSLRQSIASRWPRLLAITFFSALTWRGYGTGETVLITGGGQPIATVERDFEISPLVVDPLVTFRFGFATDEVFEPGELFDSFSVLLRNPTSGAIGFLLTADASGIIWAPAMEGGFQLDPTSIIRRPATFASVQPALANQLAYEVSFALPEAFAGERLNVVFDLFDNQNSTRSLGYFSDLTVIPEPSLGAILIGGAAITFCFKRYFKKT